MDCSNLYRTLVVGGAMLTGACAPKQAPSSETSSPSDADTTETASEPTTEVDEQPDAGTSVEEPQSTEPDIDEGELACEEICDGPPGRGRNCPDPELDLQNCCWLMSNPHPCCDE